MKIGIIGAGRVGCSIGKYLSGAGIPVAGYYDTSREAAQSAAEFTGTKGFIQIEELVAESGIIFLTTPDGIILKAWEKIRTLPLAHKIICHCSGALSSDSFSGVEHTQAVCCSIHPMLPFSDRFSSYRQLEHAFFTIEGQDAAVQKISALFTSLGNTVCRIDGADKPRYHAAASILSNQVIAVLDTGYSLLESCGFTREEAVQATAQLVRQNVENVLRADCAGALTGPIERGDTGTVQKHLDCLEPEDGQMYTILGKKLVRLAQQKNPGYDYTQMETILENNER